MRPAIAGKCITTGLIVCLLLPLMQTHAAVYRWVDDNGKVHFGDRPPPEQTADEVMIRYRPSPESDSPTGLSAKQRHQQRQKLLDAIQEEREAKEVAKQERKQEQVKRQRKCARAKNRQAQFERANRFYEINLDGSRSYLSKQQHASTKQKLAEAIKRWCR